MNVKRSLIQRIVGGALFRTRALWSDKFYLQVLYWAVLGERLDLKNPTTFNEKIQWLKLYDRNPLYTRLVDKIDVKSWVAERIGGDTIIKTLGVWDKPEDIDFDSLPSQFVLKCNHDSGGLCICTDKSTFDIESAKDKLRKSLKCNYFLAGREWLYKNVKKRIFAEEYLAEEGNMELKDYKFFCFNGEVKFLKVDFNRFIDHHANYYSLDWNLLPFGELHCPPKPKSILVCPPNFDKMLSYATILSKDIPFVRIDFYNNNGRIYFGEITFFPAGGMGKWSPNKVDEYLGNFIEIEI